MRISDWSSDVCSSDLSRGRSMIGNGAVSALSELAQHGWKSCVSGLGSSYSDSFHIEIEHKLNGLRPTRARLTPAQTAGRKLGACRRLPSSRRSRDRKSVVKGKSVTVRVEFGGRRTN